MQDDSHRVLKPVAIAVERLVVMASKVDNVYLRLFCRLRYPVLKTQMTRPVSPILVMFTSVQKYCIVVGLGPWTV